MQEAISLKDMLDKLKKRLWMIITITVLAGLFGLLLTHYLSTPSYMASTKILVSQSNESHYKYTTNTFSAFLYDTAVLDQAINQFNLDLTEGQLRSRLTVEPVPSSEVFTLTAETDDPEQSAAIVNSVAKAFQSQAKEVLKVDRIVIFSPADVGSSSAPVSPNTTRNVAAALALGLILSIGLVFLLDYLDNTVKKEEDLKKNLGLPVIGVVSHIRSYSPPETNQKKKKSEAVQPGGTLPGSGRLEIMKGGHVDAK